MLEINICHLYPDLLNLYGDIGNIIIFKNRCLLMNIKVNLINVSIGDKFVPHDYDIVFFCGGQDKDQLIVSNDILKTKRNYIKDYIDSDGYLIAICGGYQLLGHYYQKLDGEKIIGLNILDIYTEAGTDRFIGDVIIYNEQYDETYVGFENHSGKTYINNLEPLGICKKGNGNDGESQKEGCIYKNTICTYLHGPFLSKNPEISDRIIADVIKNKYNRDICINLNNSFEKSAKKFLIDRL